MATVNLPDGIEQQLLALDRQVRDATFGRGISRLALIVPVTVGICLAADWWLGLSGSVRLLFVVGCGLLAIAVAWREILRDFWRPVSLSELAALVERQHPELKERLTSLVELHEHETHGASLVMRDLLARQTTKAVERLDLSDTAPAIRSPGTAVMAFAACVLLLAPFAYSPVGYGLLWARLFAPLGNFHWGSLELIVVDGDRVVAKGSDVAIQIELRQHSRSVAAKSDQQAIVWLHLTDAVGTKDSRRLEWDSDTGRFATTLPRVTKSLQFQAVASGAQSELHRVDVADPPTIARLQLDVAPPAYTGLPARALDGAQGEVRAVERSRIIVRLGFSEPVASAELVWPIPAEAGIGDGLVADKPKVGRVIPIRVSEDKRSATVEALALSSGSFAIHLKNSVGLTNDDPPRSLVVDPDLPPAISLGGTEQPVAVRPDDRHLISAQIKDDYGLTAVELHLEASTGQKRVDSVPAEGLRERSISHEFPVDVGDFDLKPGQAITYRMHAVDNRPIPSPQETWTKPRTLMIETRSSAPQDKELAQREMDIKEQIADLREDLGDSKKALEQLHRLTEDESLKQKNSDKSQELAKLEQKQAELAERLQKLAAELAEKQLTEKLAERAQQMADRELAEAQQRLDQAKQGEPRDQLQPISEAIDRLASVDKQLQSLDQQLSELNRLEQDLEQLEQLARNTDRLAEKLEKFDQQSRETAENQPAAPVAEAGDDKPGAASNETPNPTDQPEAKSGQQPQAGDNAAPKNDPAAVEEQRQKLMAEGQKLADQLADLLKKHPELLDAARRDQLQRLEKLGEQAAELAKPQEELAKALQQAAAAAADPERPGSKPDPAGDMPKETLNDEAKPKGEQPSKKQSGDAAQASNTADAGPNNPMPDASKPGADASKPGENNPVQAQTEAGAHAVKEQQQLSQESTRQALALAQQEGADSKATQVAAEFAKQAAAAAQQAQTGNLDQAAKQGQAAALAAQETAKELAPQGQPSSKQSEQANALAERQQDLAAQMKQMAGSKPAQQGAQQQGQQQLTDATAALSQRLEQAAKDLGASPLDSKRGADAASKAKQSANDAQRAMKQAAQAAKSDNAQEAAEQAALAAEKLQEAAEQAQNATPPPQSGQAIPEDLATKVTQAAQQLQQAQKKLCSCANPSSSGHGQSGQGLPGQGQPGQGQPGQGQPGQDESGLAQSASQFRKAAAAMRRVLNEGGPQQAGNSQQLGQPGQEAQSESESQPGEPGQPGGAAAGGGANAQTDADLKQLDNELKKQAQRNWGRLPGQLRTEILQGASKKPRPEYARQIKSYFEEIAKPATKENTP